MATRVRCYLACSLDGFIAGPDDDLSWLGPIENPGDDDPGAVTFKGFMADVGAMLMGRRTHDVVKAMDVEWPYGDVPVLVATRHELEPAAPTVRRVEGDITALIAQACEAADGKDVYFDGGDLVQQGFAAGLVDELILTIVPVALGEGSKLFPAGGAQKRFELVSSHRYGGMQQLVLRPA